MRDRLSIDPGGFTTRARLAAVVASLGQAAFVELLAETPALVADLPEHDLPEQKPRTSAKAGGLTHCGEDERTHHPYNGTKDGTGWEVAVLLKAPGAPFPGLVTVGRAKACDLQLRLPTVSKIHAYFAQEEGEWFLVDQQSMNKTLHNGNNLSPGRRIPLQEGDVIRFGHEQDYRFVSPETLASWIETGRLSTGQRA